MQRPVVVSKPAAQRLAGAGAKPGTAARSAPQQPRKPSAPAPAPASRVAAVAQGGDDDWETF